MFSILFLESFLPLFPLLDDHGAVVVIVGVDALAGAGLPGVVFDLVADLAMDGLEVLGLGLHVIGTN